MAIEILQNIDLFGGLLFTDSNADFPANPKIGTMILKGNAIYAYIIVGGMETWYPFANRTNSYVHTQGLANTTWVIAHNLHTTDVWVQIKDAEGRVVTAATSVLDPDHIQISFTAAMLGSAVIVAPDSINVPEVKANLITVGANVEINTTGVLINGSYALTAANIDQQIADAIAIEATARASADATLTANLAAETSARITADSTLTANLAAETTTRASAVTTLGNDLAAEASARIASDSTLTTNLAAEASARAAADALKADISYVDTTFSVIGHAHAISDVTNLQSALDAKLDDSQLGVTVASLVNGTVPANQLPSYVDDVVEAANLAAFPATGEAGKIYVALDTNKTYRWSGSAYVYITSGAVDSVAGKTGVVVLVKGDVGLGNVDNTSDANKPVSTAQQTALNLKANLAGPTFTGVPAAPTAAAGTSTTQLATTAFVNAEIANDAAPIAHVGATGTAHGIATTLVDGFMSSADKTKVDAITGTNTGDETTATIKTKLGITTLSGSNTGDQTITLTGDVTGSGAGSFAATLATLTDTGTGTFKKFNKDTKGRITGTTAVVQADITGLLGAGSITNTMLANSAVANLSGNNTGDETTATIKTKLGITTLSGSNTGDVAVADDTATNATYYPVFATAASGAFATATVSSTKLSYNPSTGQLNATIFNSTSDRNAKDNIQPIEGALEKVKLIQGVSFTWKDNGQKSYGYIAQDIEQILPEVVATDAEGRKSVNYDATIAVLLEAVKTLAAKVDELEAKLA